MKKLLLHALSAIILLSIMTFVGCIEEEEADPPVEVNEFSIAPSSTNGRSNNYLGCIEISSRSVDISTWDHGQIDGDIISLIANGQTILSNHELDGPSNAKNFSHTFDANGFNYLVLYAHNEGDISPNTATISLNGKEFILESNLSTNGYVDIVVTGFGVECSSSGFAGGGSGGGGSGGNSSVVFWTAKDWGCGNISVELENVGTGTISQYYSSSPDCGASGSANFSGLDAGSYTFTASCTGYTWGSTFTLDDNVCLKFELQ